MDESGSNTIVTAALVIIGDEILSGRTKDQNIGYIAEHLTTIGIRLEEVRVVADDEEQIVNAVNALRAEKDYVFTTGGIGPTHDDITADSIAKAFGVGIDVDPRAVEMMKERYPDDHLNEARLRMARIPDGAELVDNSISKTPGFMMENVVVLAGIPKVMHIMLDAVTPMLRTGRKMHSTSVEVRVPEGDIADGLRQVQEAYPDISIGSYPFFNAGIYGSQLVLRSVDEMRLSEAKQSLEALLREQGLL